MSILFAILLFSLLIFLHELGHFTMAKLSGVRVNEFAVFMGPAIWKKQKGETLYSIRCIPIGGYCAMEGEDGGSDDPRSFDAAAWWKRFVILVAGSAMNFLTGLILLGVFFAGDKQFIMPVVTQIEPGCTIAGEHGIREGDRILDVDGEKIYVYSDFQMILDLNGGENHDLVLLRDGERLELKDFPMAKAEFLNEDGSKSLRFGFSFSLVEATFRETMKYVWNTAIDNVRMVRLSLQMLFSGQAGIRDVGGPVMIVQQMSQVAEAAPSAYYAFLNLIYFGAFIAINLAVMNLLPIPALDGGRVVCLLITTAVEAVTRKKINPKFEAYLHAGGMILLLALMGLIMFKDIFVLIKG